MMRRHGITLASDGKIKLSGSGQIRADELRISQLNLAEIALRIQKIISEAPPCR